MAANLPDAIRGLIEAIEAGHVNTAQREALHKIRVILGDAADVCVHANTAYETIKEIDNYLICQDCRAILVTPIEDANLIQLTR